MNYCVACGEDFGSLKAFDRHRVGTFDYTFTQGLDMTPLREDGRRCLGVDEIETLRNKKGELVFERSTRGRWSIASDIADGQALRAGASDAGAKKPPRPGK